MRSPISAVLASVLALASVALACGGSGSTMDRIYAAQYPHDFHYITKGEIRTQMAKLAVQVVTLDELLSKEGGPTAEDRNTVIAILGRMRSIVGQLKKAGAKSSHPLIDQDAPRLRENIDRAIAEARMSSPPTYYAAGRVVGSCSYCHEQRVEVQGTAPSSP